MPGVRQSDPIHQKLDALLQAVDPTRIQMQMRSTLAQIVRAEAAQIDSLLTEYDAAQPGTGSSNVGWRAQTSNTEVIQGIIVSVPADSTSCVLTIGEYTIPLTTAYPGSDTTSVVHSLTNLNIVVKNQNRSLTYASASTTIGSTCLLWGRAAPASNAPGILH